MFTYSSSYSSSPKFLTVQKGFNSDTICTTTNIVDFDFKKDTLRVFFKGLPKLYNKEIKTKVFDQTTIIIDTTGIN